MSLFLLKKYFCARVSLGGIITTEGREGGRGGGGCGGDNVEKGGKTRQEFCPITGRPNLGVAQDFFSDLKKFQRAVKTLSELMVVISCLPGGGGTPLYRYVRPQRVWFLSPFGLK